jgi:23S rRNA (cytosine1962-C5)-methyltransferase
MLEALLQAQRKRQVLGLPNAETTAFRLVHGAADGVPDLTVDIYGDFAVVSVYAEGVGPRERDAFQGLLRLGYHGVYLKHRPQKASGLSEAERQKRAPNEPVAGEPAPAVLTVCESDAPFLVRLGDGFSTGLFLDQRENRARVLRSAAGLSVLNLFAYTCAFGLMAARGGARATTNIDVAKPALSRGRESYEHAGVAGDSHRFLLRDVLDTLPRMARAGELFELVVLDPPSFASTKNGRFSVERDYAALLAQALSVTAPGGALLACTNHHGLTEQTFVACLRQGLARADRAAQRLELVPPPADHPVLPTGVAHLKSAWIQLR